MTGRRAAPGSAGSAVVVGAGLVGPVAAILLARDGFRVTLVEASGDPAQRANAFSRSINITLAERGLAVLRRVGLEERILADLCTPLRCRAVHHAAGTVSEMAYGSGRTDVIYSTSRTDLSRLLSRAAAAEPGVDVRFGTRCVAVDPRTPSVTTVDVASGARETLPADLVIGADGVHSLVRENMQRVHFADISLDYVPWRYKELTVSGGLMPGAFHAWPRGDFMFFCQPNLAGTYNGVVVLPATGPQSFDAVINGAGPRAFFAQHFPDIEPHMKDLEQQFTTNPVAAFPTLLTSHWHHAGKVALVGDACHSVLPFYGQGMNVGLEDCVELIDCLREYPSDRAAALARYQRRRKPHTDALATLSRENFAEMRDLNQGFRVEARKNLVLALHRRQPTRVIPLYTLVAHSSMPIAACVARSRRQEVLLRAVGGEVAVALVAGYTWLRHWARRIIPTRTPHADQNPGSGDRSRGASVAAGAPTTESPTRGRITIIPVTQDEQVPR